MPESTPSGVMRSSSRRRAASSPVSPPGGGATSAQSLVTAAGLLARPLDENAREQMIAEAAYYRAEQRCFAPGHELEDWLAAESEIDAFLQRVYGEGRSF